MFLAVWNLRMLISPFDLFLMAFDQTFRKLSLELYTEPAFITQFLYLFQFFFKLIFSVFQSACLSLLYYPKWSWFEIN